MQYGFDSPQAGLKSSHFLFAPALKTLFDQAQEKFATVLNLSLPSTETQRWRWYQEFIRTNSSFVSTQPDFSSLPLLEEKDLAEEERKKKKKGRNKITKKGQNKRLPPHACILARSLILGGIGYQGKLPWDIPIDRQRFSKITTFNKKSKANILIMGKSTWQSFSRPLAKRIHIIISATLHNEKCIKKQGGSRSEIKKTFVEDPSHLVSEQELISTPTFFPSIRAARPFLDQIKTDRTIFVIGGCQLFRESFSSDSLHTIYLTTVQSKNLKWYLTEKEMVNQEKSQYDVFFHDGIPHDKFYLKSRDPTIDDGEYVLHFDVFRRRGAR
jgi:dihydrofolate reductase